MKSAALEVLCAVFFAAVWCAMVWHAIGSSTMEIL